MIENGDVIGFNKLLSTWKQVYKWKTTSFVAVRTSDGAKLLVGRIVFDCDKPDDNLLFRLESTCFIAGREITSTTSEDVDSCITNAMQGKLSSSMQLFPLYLNLKTYDTLRTNFYSVYQPTVNLGIRLPNLIISGSRKQELLSVPYFRPNEMPDWDLKGADQPFDSLDELFRHLDFPESRQAGDLATLEIVGRMPALIEKGSIISKESGLLKCVLADAAETSKIKFGYIIFHNDNSKERACITGDAFKWIVDGSLKIGSAIVSTKDAAVLKGFLSYGGIVLHQEFIDDPAKRVSSNSRRAIHEIFDKDLSIVKMFLLTDTAKQNDSFEHGVAMLLGILGFSVFHYGTVSIMQEGPDILAITPNGNVGVIECTIGLLDNKHKLSKLVQRTFLIKEQLSKAGYGHLLVQPVIVTQLVRDEIKADLDRAGENGIAVVCREEIEELLKRVAFAPNPDGIFKEAQQLIPNNNKTSADSLFSS